MIRAALLLALFGVCLAFKQEGYGYKPKTNKCYSCEFRPSKTRTYKVPRQESYDVQVPVHRQECSEQQVLAGHKVTKVEKRTHTHFQPAYGSHSQAGYGNQAGYGQQVGYGQQDSYHKQPAESYSNKEPVYKTVKKCVPKVDYKTETRYRTEYDTKTEETGTGGFDACMGPLTYDMAKKDGVDAWDCHSACFVRKDYHGNVFRGCYKGEFGLNPNGPATQFQHGQEYRFCHGDYCNDSQM